MKIAPIAVDRAAVVAAIEAHAADLRRRGVTSLDLFGSRARLDNAPNSDLDVLIEYDGTRKFSLYDLVAVERLLARVTGLEVHVATRDAFRPERLGQLLRDSVGVL